MPNDHYPTLREISADRNWWLQDNGAHYKELAGWLHEFAGKCGLPNPQRELLRLARKYERKAENLEQKAH
jgi:hypothetical protein